MAWTIEEALKDESIEGVEKNTEGWSFFLKGINTQISVILSVNPNGGFNFKTSHAIHTPEQNGPYHPSRPWGDDQGYALHQAISSITKYYRQATNNNHTPSESWLVPNI